MIVNTAYFVIEFAVPEMKCIKINEYPRVLRLAKPKLREYVDAGQPYTQAFGAIFFI